MNMKKKLLQVLLILTLLMPVCLVPASAADIGPKPSVVIDFDGLEGQTYYVTLLSQQERGPWSFDELYDDYYGPETVWNAFRDYEDPDGYRFIGYFKDCTETQEFRWTYYPPQEFKVLLYFPETDSFLVSPGSFQQYAFDSYFSAKISAGDVMLKQTYDFTWELLSLVCRCLATIAVELAVAWCFRFRTRDLLRMICLTNVVTQIVLNLALNWINYRSGAMAFVVFYVLLEFLVFLIEAVVYARYLRRHPQDTALHPVGYALAANLISFVVGMAVAEWMPGIF